MENKNHFQGSYECVCVEGFLRNAKNGLCIDIDECNSESADVLCQDPYECSNTIGSYECICSAGLVQVNRFSNALLLHVHRLFHAVLPIV